MKKFALSLVIASAAVFGVGTATSAQYGSTTTTTTTTVAPTTTSAGSGAGLPTTTVAPATTVAATTPPAGLPATGSDGIGTTTGIAIGLLVVGLGLFIVTRVRRGQPGAA
jgi:hypothetical protein